MSIFPIILNQSNAVSGDSSTYIYKFPRGSIKLKSASVALSQLNLFYSWANISKAFYNNSEFSIIFPDGSPSEFAQYDIVIPDGNYTIEDINRYIQSVFITNKKYLINNATGDYRYFMEILANPTTYSIQLITYDIPNSLPSGYSEPPGGFTGGFPATGTLQPSLIISSINKFGDLIGFLPGFHFSSVSQKTPQMSPVSSVLVTCSLVNNKFTNPNNIIFSFVSGSTEYGRMMSIQNQDIQYSRIDDGLYTEVAISFIDNNFRRLNIKDTNLVIYLIVKIDE